MEKPSFTSNGAGDSMPSSDINEPLLSLPEQAGLPSINLSDKRMWWFYRNSEDLEIIDLVSAAERWARAMQKQLSEEATIDTIWIETFAAAFDQDATDYYLAKAVAILSQCWEHGELLRRVYDGYKKETAYHPTVEDFPY